MASPRLFGIPALDAPVVAVLRRGPSGWAGVGRWDVDAMTYEHGAWLRGTLYPQRCDLSPDGRWLAYFALKNTTRWSLGATYVAISKLPWLTALAAWGTCGTWTRGLHFDLDPSVWTVGEPDEGALAPLRGRLGLAVTAPASFAAERRRGWAEVPGSPPRAKDDMWDERRAAALKLAKPRPGDAETVLEVSGTYAAFRSGPRTADVAYRVGGTPLPDAQRADWAADGRLLVATRGGELQAREAGTPSVPVAVVAALAQQEPAPSSPPPEARKW